MPNNGPHYEKGRYRGTEDKICGECYWVFDSRKGTEFAVRCDLKENGPRESGKLSQRAIAQSIFRRIENA